MKRLLVIGSVFASLFITGTASAANMMYTVQDNDTFWSISQYQGIPVSQILTANPSVDPNLLYAGMKINLPIPNQYTVQNDNETFWTIAQKFNVNESDLLKANSSISPNNIYSGLILTIPSGNAVTPLTWEQKADAIINTGKTQLGVPYVFGGDQAGVGFDCSGFTQYAFNQNGFNLPHNAAMQSQLGTPVSKDQLRKGDLVFLSGTYTAGVSHVAIYLGNNQVLHASTLGGTREVKITTLFGNPYYDEHYWGARRIIN